MDEATLLDKLHEDYLTLVGRVVRGTSGVVLDREAVWAVYRMNAHLIEPAQRESFAAMGAWVGGANAAVIGMGLMLWERLGHLPGT
jgi:hypothetical protein